MLQTINKLKSLKRREVCEVAYNSYNVCLITVNLICCYVVGGSIYNQLYLELFQYFIKNTLKTVSILLICHTSTHYKKVLGDNLKTSKHVGVL